MATVNDVIQGLAQAAANAYDGALDDKGEQVKIGLRREVDNPITDSRMMDGFKVRFVADKMILGYHSEIKLKEVHDKGFEDEMASMCNDIVKFLKKEYKKVTGNAVTLTKEGEMDALVQKTSNVRAWVQVTCTYKIGGIDASEAGKPREDVDASIKKWLAIGKDKFPGAKKPKNQTAKNG
tara:strand:+ start:198 stop:737 length:540 start_codon:yes stop_codon:yes gene_type:complete